MNKQLRKNWVVIVIFSLIALSWAHILVVLADQICYFFQGDGLPPYFMRRG